MSKKNLSHLPAMLFADSHGRIYDHPYFRMAGMSGRDRVVPRREELIELSEFSKLFYFPECPPMGLDPQTGDYVLVPEIEMEDAQVPCFAVAAFPEPGVVRSLLPAVDYRDKSYVLPMWAYTAVGFQDEKYLAAGFRVESNPRWDPANYDDRNLIPAINRYREENPTGPLIEHLIHCATRNHCFAAKNLFLERWEAPAPVSRRCNAACLGCLSLQPAHSCEASHRRISFRPSVEEIVSLAVGHLNHAPGGIISFGQGCEGEPLTESRFIAESIRQIRTRTRQGTINLNTNGSMPEEVQRIIESGLDSIRISLNSARPALYRAYYRPKKYGFEDVLESIALSRRMGIYTMLNYLVFPGVTDQEEELVALADLISRTDVNFLHLKNLCVDPDVYLQKMPKGAAGEAMGLAGMCLVLEEEFPDLELGYFNQPVR